MGIDLYKNVPNPVVLVSIFFISSGFYFLLILAGLNLQHKSYQVQLYQKQTACTVHYRSIRFLTNGHSPCFDYRVF